MTAGKLYLTVKYPRLLFWINVPFVMLGLKPIAPSWMFKITTNKPDKGIV